MSPNVCGKTLVLGIGNSLLGDEGIGIHAIRYLGGRSLPAEVDLVDGGTLSFTLAGAIAEAQRLVVVDAAELHAGPGTVRTFLGEDMDRFLGSNRRLSVHEVSLDDLLAITRLTGDLPAQRALVAVQPRLMNWSEGLSPELASSLPLVADAVQDVISLWAEGQGA